MIKVYICEDNDTQRERMSAFVDDILGTENLNMEKSVVTGDPFKILEAISQESEAGVFFLDIDLEAEINGLELAKRIRELQPRCFIVFVTTHSEMAFMTFSYRVEAMDFIIKDNTEELKSRVHQCLIKAGERSKVSVQNKYYSIKIGDSIRVVPYDSIVYFEAATDSRKIILHTWDAIYEFAGKLKNIEEDVDETFYRCHRGYIINRNHIKEVDREKRIVYLANGDDCPMSVRLGKGL